MTGCKIPRGIKLCLDLASSLLVFSGRFEAGYRARLSRLEELALAPSAQQLPVRWKSSCRWCGGAQPQNCSRIMGSTEAIPWTHDGHPSACAAEAGNDFASQTTLWAWQSWLWELRHMTGREYAGAEQMVRDVGRGLGGKRLLRGWLYAVRRAGWLRSARHWPNGCVCWPVD